MVNPDMSCYTWRASPIESGVREKSVPRSHVFISPRTTDPELSCAGLHLDYKFRFLSYFWFNYCHAQTSKVHEDPASWLCYSLPPHTLNVTVQVHAWFKFLSLRTALSPGPLSTSPLCRLKGTSRVRDHSNVCPSAVFAFEGRACTVFLAHCAILLSNWARCLNVEAPLWHWFWMIYRAVYNLSTHCMV